MDKSRKGLSRRNESIVRSGTTTKGKLPKSVLKILTSRSDSWAESILF